MIVVDSCGSVERFAKSPHGELYEAAMRQARVVALDADLAIGAARLGRAFGLPLADSIIYATARRDGAELWTHHEHFRDLPGVCFIAAPAPG